MRSGSAVLSVRTECVPPGDLGRSAAWTELVRIRYPEIHTHTHTHTDTYTRPRTTTKTTNKHNHKQKLISTIHALALPCSFLTVAFVSQQNYCGFCGCHQVTRDPLQLHTVRWDKKRERKSNVVEHSIFMLTYSDQNG